MMDISMPMRLVWQATQWGHTMRVVGIGDWATMEPGSTVKCTTLELSSKQMMVTHGELITTPMVPFLLAVTREYESMHNPGKFLASINMPVCTLHLHHGHASWHTWPGLPTHPPHHLCDAHSCHMTLPRERLASMTRFSSPSKEKPI